MAETVVSEEQIDGDIDMGVLPGNMWHGEIEAWIRNEGGWGKGMRLLDSLDSNKEYEAWLREVVGEKDAFPEQVRLAEGKPDKQGVIFKGLTTLLHLKAATSHEYGHRGLMPMGVKAIVGKLLIQSFSGGWREWDIVRACHLSDSDGKDFLIKFHHRAACLHLLAYFFWKRATPVPEGFLGMMKQITLHHYGSTTRAKACAIGLQHTHGMANAVKPSYLDIILQSKSQGEHFGADLHHNVSSLCPEHINSMTEWKRLKDFCTRVTDASYQAVTDFMVDNSMQAPPLLQTHLEQFFLAPARLSARPAPKRPKHEEFLTADEQPHAIKKLLALTKSIADNEGIPLAHANFMMLIQRRIDKDARAKIVRLTKKFLIGIDSAGRANKTTYHTADLCNRFYSGEFDTVVDHANDATVSSKYWPFVKEIDKQREELALKASLEADQHAAQEAEEQALSLSSEVDTLQNNMDEMQEKSLHASVKEIMLKLMQSYRLQLKVFHAKEIVGLQATLAKAEELWVLRQDDLAKEEASFSGSEFRTLGLVGKGALKMFASDSPLMPLLLNSRPPLIWIDVAYASFSADIVPKALRMVGNSGLVAIVSSSTLEMTSALMLCEQDMLSQVDTSQAWMARVFLSWKDPRLVGSMVLLENNCSEESCTGIAKRARESEAVKARGAIMNLLGPDSDELVLASERRFMHPHQRGTRCLTALLQGIGVLTSSQVSGAQPLDFLVLEADAGVGCMFKVVKALQQAQPKTPEDLGMLQWVGGFCTGGPERSTTIRQSYVEGLMQEHEENAKQARRLSRHPSATSQTLQELAESLPKLPQLPPKLCELLKRHHTLASVQEEMIDIGTADASQCKACQAPPRDNRFVDSVPAPLALQWRCVQSKVMVAPSELGMGMGLYPTASIKSGDVVLVAESPARHWCGIDELKDISLKHSLRISLQQTFRKPVVMVCEGDPARYAWPYINSAKHTGRQPNLGINVGLGEMDDSFASLVALQDIQEFGEELLLDYRIQYNVPAAPVQTCSAEAPLPRPIPTPMAPPLLSSMGSEAPAQLQEDLAFDGGTPQIPKPEVVAKASASMPEAFAKLEVINPKKEAAQEITKPQVVAQEAEGSAKEEVQQITKQRVVAQAEGSVKEEVKEDQKKQKEGAEVGCIAEASKGAANDDPPAVSAGGVEIKSIEKLEEVGVKVADFSQPGFLGTVKLVPGNNGSVGTVWFTCDKPQWRMPRRLVTSIFGGKTKGIVPMKILEYNINEESYIYVSAERKKVKDCFPLVKKVYGKTVEKNKVAPIVQDGKEIQMWWCPPDESIPLVQALMACKNISTTFIMSITNEAGSTEGMLAPSGVAFMTGTFDFAPKDAKKSFGQFK